MTWLAFVFALEAGFHNQSFLWYTGPNFDSLSAGYQIESPYTQLEAGFVFFDFLEFGGSAQIYVVDTPSWQYAPFDSRYMAWVRARIKWFELGYEHLCVHPVLSSGRPNTGFLYGGGDRIYLRVEGKIGGQ